MEENKHFAEKFNFPYPLLSDPTRAMGVQYGAADSTKAGNAKRVAYIIGPEGKVKNVFPKANTSTFAATKNLTAEILMIVRAFYRWPGRPKKPGNTASTKWPPISGISWPAAAARGSSDDPRIRSRSRPLAPPRALGA